MTQPFDNVTAEEYSNAMRNAHLIEDLQNENERMKADLISIYEMVWWEVGGWTVSDGSASKIIAICGVYTSEGE